MKTVSLRLPEMLDAKLSALAREQKRTKSEIVRDALEDFLKNGARPVRMSAYEMSRDLCGAVDDAPPDLSANKKYMEEYGR